MSLSIWELLSMEIYIFNPSVCTERKSSLSLTDCTAFSYHLLVHSRAKLFWISPAYINHAISWRPQAGRGDCYAAIRPAEVSASGLRVMHVQAYLC